MDVSSTVKQSKKSEWGDEEEEENEPQELIAPYAEFIGMVPIMLRSEYCVLHGKVSILSFGMLYVLCSLTIASGKVVNFYSAWQIRAV